MPDQLPIGTALLWQEINIYSVEQRTPCVARGGIQASSVPGILKRLFGLIKKENTIPVPREADTAHFHHQNTERKGVTQRDCQTDWIQNRFSQRETSSPRECRQFTSKAEIIAKNMLPSFFSPPFHLNIALTCSSLRAVNVRHWRCFPTGTKR